MSRKMKDSGIEWVGLCPEDWSVTRMKSCVKQRDSGVWGNDQRNDKSDVICLRIADFDFSKFRFQDKDITDLTKRNYQNDIENIVLKKGDIVIEKSGGGEKTPVGRAVIFDKDYRAVYANFCDRIRCRDIISPYFMEYVLVSFYKNQYIWNYIKQTTGLQNLDLTSMLAKEKVALPLLKEQTKISEYLNDKCGEIDNIISKTQASIEEYKKLKQSIITQAVTKGVRGEREMKSSKIERVDYIPCDWVELKMKYFIYIRARLGWKGLKAEEYVDNGYTFIGTPNIDENGKIDWENVYYITKERYDESPEIKLSEGDVLLTKDGAGIGKCAFIDYLPNEAAPNGSLAVITCNELMNGKYLFYYLKSYYFQKYIDQIKAGMGVPHLFQGDLKEIIIAVPPINEQIEIINFLDKKCSEIEEIIRKKEMFLIELDSYKKSMIYEYVTGKKEVI